MRKINPRNLRFVVFAVDVDSQEVCKEVHVAKYDYRNHKTTATACGIGGVKEAYSFPMYKSIWEKPTTPVCEACYQIVAGQIDVERW